MIALVLKMLASYLLGHKKIVQGKISKKENIHVNYLNNSNLIGFEPRNFTII
jgi:hypothetical protein